MSDEKKTAQVAKDPSLYYFYSVGCGWCKKAEPIVDEINAEGKFEILKLDLADETNRKINEELKKKYDVQCGTPWFIDAETGNGFCGYRDKETMLKWANGEEIPKPVRPTGPPPKPPLLGVSKKEEKKWIKEYDEWYKKNEKLPNIKTSKEILEMPRPKSDPPKPPVPTSTDAQLDEWGKEYDKWSKENDHLPNLIPSKQIVDRFKQNRDKQNQPQPPMGGSDNQSLNVRMNIIEQKLDRLMAHLGVKSPISNIPPKPPVKGTHVKAKSNKK